MVAKAAHRHLLLGGISILIIAALLLFIQSRFGKAAAGDIRALELDSVTSVSSSNPAINYTTNAAGEVLNDNTGISVWTGSFPTPYTECGHLGLPASTSKTTNASLANTWEHRNTCQGKIAVGGAQSWGAQVLTIIGTKGGKNVTINVTVPARTGSSNMRLYVSDTGGTYECKTTSHSGTYPNDCNLTTETALVATNEASPGSAAVCGNNLCQAGETYASCAADCPNTCDAATSALTRDADGQFYDCRGTKAWCDVIFSGPAGTNNEYFCRDGFGANKTPVYTEPTSCQQGNSLCKKTSSGASYCASYCPSTYDSVTCSSGYAKCTGSTGTSCKNSCTSTETIACPSGYAQCNNSWDNSKYCNSGTQCPVICASGSVVCTTSTGSQYCSTGTTCPTPVGPTPTCTTGQIICYSSTNTQYCHSGSSCPSITGGNGGGSSCESGKISCVGSGGINYCYSGTTCPQPTACTASQVACPGSGSNAIPYCYNGTTCPSTTTPPACGAGQISCTSTTGASYCHTGTSCPSTTPVPPPVPPGDVISRQNNECYAGETCVKGSWCTTKFASASTSPLPGSFTNAWLDNCFFPNGNVTCVERSSNANICGPAPTQACPTVNSVPTSHCRPDDTNCRDIGQKGPANAWCWSGQRCYNATGSELSCEEFGKDCPSDYPNQCNPTDTNCIETGKTGPNEGWCVGDAEGCYAKDGSGKLCVKRDYSSIMCAPLATTSASFYSPQSPKCPAGYSSCRPDDKLCTAIGDSNKNSGAYCMGGKQCNTDDGIQCVEWNADCPKGAKLCPKTDSNCHEPDEEFTYTDNIWPWCPQGMSIYSLTGYKGYCLSMPMPMPADFIPKLKAGYGFCRLNDTYCLEPGEEAPDATGGYYCGWHSPAVPMPSYYQSNSKIKCPKLEEKVVEPEEPEEPEPDIDAAKAEQEALVCINDAKRLLENIQKTLDSAQELASNDVRILTATKENIENSFQSWENLINTKAWKKVREGCLAKKFEWQTRELDQALKRVGNAQAGQYLLERIQAMRSQLDGLDKDGIEYGEDVKDLVEFMLDMLDEAEEYVNNREYGLAKDTLRELNHYRRELEKKLASYDVELEDDVRDSIAKYVEEKVLAKIHEVISKKMENFSNVMAELIEKNLQRLMENLATVAEKVTEIALNAVTKAVENAMYIAEERVKERFLQRIDDLTATVKVLEEQVATGTCRAKIEELNGLLVSYPWTAATAQELQEDIAKILAAKAEGQACVVLLPQIDAVLAKAKAKMADVMEARNLVDEGVMGFRDAPITRWDGGFMLAAKNSCIAQGRGDDPYTLDATRNSIYQETVALTIRTAGIPLEEGPLLEPIPGLPATSWSIPYFRTLQETGYEFEAAYNADTTRLEAAKLMFALLKSKLPNVPDETKAREIASAFNDYDVFKDDAEAVQAVAAMQTNNLMTGYGQGSQFYGSFGAIQPMTRNMLITVMVRASELVGTDPCELQH